MKRLRKVTAALMVFFGFALLPVSLRAQGFLYTNEHQFGPTTVSGFSVASNGTLTAVPGSPFATGGTGDGDDFLTTNLITVGNVGNFLFASNDISNDVSVFNINAATGTLSLVPGSPFATGGSRSTSLSQTPDGKFLIVSNNFSGNLTVFSIASNGALTPVVGSPFLTQKPTPGGIKVSPDGKFLAVAEPLFNQVEMFSIASNGSLTSLGAFPGGGQNSLAKVDIDCTTRVLYGGEDSSSFPGTIVDGYSIASNGGLTPVPGSPFTAPLGCVAGFCGGSGGVLLSPNDKTLFVSNTYSYTMTVFSVASDGRLSLVPGSPFPMRGAAPFDMATSQNGSLLYSATFQSVSVFNVASSGTLTEVAGSPFFIQQSQGQESLTAFPPKSCELAAPTITSISPTSAIAGGAAFTLTLNGTNFVSGSTVSFNGNARATTFVSATQLTATIPASDIATAGSFNVTVTNLGGTTSNAISFTVVTPEQATQTIINSVNTLFSQGVINGGQDKSLVVQLQHAINLMNTGKNAGAIGNLDSFISEVNDLLSSGVLSPSQVASLISTAESVIARLS